ncbi:MAG: EamA family transporter [Candidatus Aminicenantales bacterium]|jgi:drug/metabolite transporter (DMT)-like permease
MRLNPVVSVLLAAALFGLSTPLAKALLGEVPPVALAGLLYLGVFLGLTLYAWASRAAGRGRRGARDCREARLEKRDLPWLAGAILAGGVMGPICLMAGLSRITGFSASLLLNFEGLATALIAVLLFKENAGKRVWLSLTLMTAAGVILSWNPGGGRFSPEGPVLVILAMIGWGIDNNLTRQISDKDPVEIARIKGLVAGAVSTSAAFLLGRGFRPAPAAAYGLLIGAFCYGLSLVLFIRALKRLGAFRTGALFSLGPFVGSLASLVLLKDSLRWPMSAAGLLMVIAVALIVSERHVHGHRHERTVHTHSHGHGDLHHLHAHEGPVHEPHAHEHVHEATDHVHGHWPDTHHRHHH